MGASVIPILGREQMERVIRKDLQARRVVELLSQRSLLTPLGGVEGWLGLAVERVPLYGAGQRNLDPSAGFTPPVADVATMPRELLAMQAGHSTVRDRTRACVPIALRFQGPLRKAEEDAWSEWEVLCMGSV